MIAGDRIGGTEGFCFVDGPHVFRESIGPCE